MLTTETMDGLRFAIYDVRFKMYDLCCTVYELSPRKSKNVILKSSPIHFPRRNSALICTFRNRLFVVGNPHGSRN